MASFQILADEWSSLRGRQSHWLSYWQDLTDVLQPNQNDFIRQNTRGTSRETAIYDGTPRIALRDLASTLDGLMKPKTSNWFEPTVDDEQIAAIDESKIWLEIVRERMWRSIYSKGARFIQRSGEVDQSLAAIGWGTLWLQENKTRNGLLFRSFHASKVAYDENEDGIIDKIAVTEMMSPRQVEGLYKRVGKSPSTVIVDALRRVQKGTERFPIVQIVVPQGDKTASTFGGMNMPFLSAVLDIKGEQIITEMGFMEFPAAIPRWDTSPDEIYPRSPGMMALPDAKTLQAMGKTLLVGGQRAVDPPIWVQNDSILSSLRTFPGGVTVLDTSDASGAPIGAFPTSTNIPLGREMQNDYRRNVEAAFFKNVFNLPIQSRTMTATEILERKEEFIRVIGPVFGRLETDYIGQTVDRAFGIMERAGAFPPRPDVLLEQTISFKFQSPIQQARRQLEIAGMARALEVLEPLRAHQPEIMDNFDGDEITRDAPVWSGMPQKWMRTLEGVEGLRTSRAEQQQKQEAMASVEPTSKALKNVASAEGVLAQQG